MPINLDSTEDLTPHFAGFSKVTDDEVYTHAALLAVSEVNHPAVDDAELLEYYFDNLTWLSAL